MTQRSYTRGPSSLLVALLVRLERISQTTSLTHVGMVSQFAVYPIDTLKL
jgi:hypothetical protein